MARTCSDGVVQIVEGRQGLRPRGARGGYVAVGVVGVADVGQGFCFLVAEAEFVEEFDGLAVAVCGLGVVAEVAVRIGEAVEGGRLAVLVAVLRCPIACGRPQHDGPDGTRSDARRELVEGLAEPVLGGNIGSDVVVTAAQILDEGMSGGDDSGGPGAFQSAHRPQPGLQPPMICLDRIVRVALDGTQR